MFWFYIIILSSHIINGLLAGFARAILRNTGPWSFSTALASSGCTKTAVLYFSVWPSHTVNKPLVLMLSPIVIMSISHLPTVLSIPCCAQDSPPPPLSKSITIVTKVWISPCTCDDAPGTHDISHCTDGSPRVYYMFPPYCTQYRPLLNEKKNSG